MTDHSEIRIGEFTLSYLADGTLWFSRDGGEGMQLGEETEMKLAAIIDAFFNAEM